MGYDKFRAKKENSKYFNLAIDNSAQCAIIEIVKLARLTEKRKI